MATTLSFRGKTHQLNLDDDAMGSDLIDAAVSLSQLNPNRVSVSYEKGGQRVPVVANQKLSTIPVRAFVIVDSGPQFSYYGIYMLQYCGTLILWPIMTFFLRPPDTTYFRCATFMWMLHFFKRVVETQVVHIFSRATAPVSQLLRKCGYYWSTAALMTFYVHKTAKDRSVNLVLLALFLIFELANLYCHVKLRFLRPRGSKDHYVPTGFLFNSITCPHYSMEVLSWMSFAMFVRVWPAYLFLIIESLHMFFLADDRRRGLIFANSDARKRGRITPFTAL